LFVVGVDVFPPLISISGVFEVTIFELAIQLVSLVDGLDA
jgi:hypothetical protein